MAQAAIAVPLPPAGRLLRRADRRFTSLAWLQREWLFALLCVVSALPLVIPAMPPLTDLGGHLGRYAVQIDGGADPVLRQWYTFRWALIPNLGVDLLVQALSPLLGLEPALKAIVIATVVIHTGGLLALAWTVHRRLPPTALFALPLVLGYPFTYGFLNFQLGLALGTWLLALWVAWGRAGRTPGRWLVLAACAAGLWVCHMAAWGLFCLLAAADEWVRQRRRSETAGTALRRNALALAALAPPLLLPLLADSPPARGETGGFFQVIAKLGWLVMALRDRWAVWDVAGALLLIGLISWTWCSRRFSRDRGLALGAGLLAVAFVALPRHVHGTSFVDMRVVPTMLAIALIAVRPNRHCPRRVQLGLAIAALLFVGLRTMGMTASTALFSREFDQTLALLDSVPRHGQLVTLDVITCGTDPWARERRTHLAGYALARRHAFANDQWEAQGAQLLSVHDPAAGRFQIDKSQMTGLVACKQRPAIGEAMAMVPAGTRWAWVIGLPPHAGFAGWQRVRSSADASLFTRAGPVITPR